MDAQPKIGQKIKIISLSSNDKGIPDPDEQKYIGKTGIINYIDGTGTIWDEIINKEGDKHGESENN